MFYKPEIHVLIAHKYLLPLHGQRLFVMAKNCNQNTSGSRVLWKEVVEASHDFFPTGLSVAAASALNIFEKGELQLLMGIFPLVCP